MSVKTVGELIELLKKVPPETKVGTWNAYDDRLEEGACVSLLTEDDDGPVVFIGTLDLGAEIK